MTQALAWTPFAFVVFVATLPLWKRAWAVLSGLVEWEGPGGKLTVGGTTAVTILTFGALAYGVGAGGGIAGVITSAVGSPGTPTVDPPNSPIVDATVYRAQGDSLWISGGTFVGSGSDTHDSTYIKVDSTGGGKSYHLDTLGAIERDSVGGNVAALDSGAVVDIVMKYKGVSGGWSAPDTLTGVQMVEHIVSFHSDWDSVGTSAYSLYDSASPTPWRAVLNGGNNLEVITSASASLNFPTTNALEITADNGGSGTVPAAQPWNDTLSGYWGVPAVGGSLYYRYYIRIATPGTYLPTDDQTHGSQDGPQFGDRTWQHEIRTNSTFNTTNAPGGCGSPQGTNAGTWLLTLTMEGGPSFETGFVCVELNNDTDYRIEQQVRRFHADSMEFHMRVYDVVGDSLLYDDGDFRNSNNSAFPLADSTAYAGGIIGARSLLGFRTGQNGLPNEDTGEFPFVWAYLAGWAVCETNWCGAYPATGEGG